MITPASPVMPPWIAAQTRQLLAQRGGIEPGEQAPIVSLYRVEQPGGGSDVGAHRMRTAATTLRKVGVPCFEQVGAGHTETKGCATISARIASSRSMPASLTPNRPPSRQIMSVGCAPMRTVVIGTPDV